MRLVQLYYFFVKGRLKVFYCKRWQFPFEKCCQIRLISVSCQQPLPRALFYETRFFGLRTTHRRINQ